MKLPAIRLSPQAGKSLVISSILSRKRARRQTNRYASFALTMQFIDSHCHINFPELAQRMPELLQKMIATKIVSAQAYADMRQTVSALCNYLLLPSMALALIR